MTNESSVLKKQISNTIDDHSAFLDATHHVQAVIEFDLDGTIRTANENFLSITGYELDEIQGQHHRVFCDPAYAQSDEYKDFWLRLAMGEFTSGEFQRVGKNGSEIWINASYNPIFDANGNPVKVIKFVSDITAEKRLTAEQSRKTNAISGAQAAIEFEFELTT